MPGFRPISDGKFVLDRRDAEGADHHGGKSVGKLALEHRAFARHYAMVSGNFIGQKGRKNIRQMHLPASLEVSLRKFEVLAHHAELDPIRT